MPRLWLKVSNSEKESGSKGKKGTTNIFGVQIVRKEKILKNTDAMIMSPIFMNAKKEECNMSEKIIYKVPAEERIKSIETLKVREKTLEYLHKNKFKTIEDIIDRQGEISSEFRGNIYAYLMFGIED